MNWFEFFFKHDPIVYERGTLAFQWLSNPAMFAVFVVIAGAGAWLLYRSLPPASSWGMIALRALTFSILAFILMRPVLNVSTVLPQESYVAVLIDDSESMQIQDDGVESRAQRLFSELESSQFAARLNERFNVRWYRFSREAERIEDLNRMTFAGSRTRMQSGLDLIFQDLATVPVSNLVLITDGRDNASETWTEALSRVQARGIPLHTVGVGEDSIDEDAELTGVAAPRKSLNDATAVVEVSFRSHGLRGRPATVQVRENGVLIKTEQVTLPPDGEIGEAAIDLPMTNEGSRVFEFAIEAQGDRIPQNNSFTTLIEVTDDEPEILYVEGEPRWEYKFINRALEDDANLRVVTLLRTSPNKFYRQGIADETVLAEGFPTTREELFAYKGLIIGSVESTFFTQEQQQMIVDFVDERRGGFMMIGGRNAFSGGRYQNTPIADILPVYLDEVTTDFVTDPLTVRVTDVGLNNPLMQLSPTGEGPITIWDDLPQVTEYNAVGEKKTGARVLAEGLPDSGRTRPIVLAIQNYGGGRTAAFTTASSWRWQMKLPHEDVTHETFWRQLLRWLVSASPDPVVAWAEKDSYVPGETVRLFADVSNAAFDRLNNADVRGRVIDPDGSIQNVRFEWTGLEDGTYQSRVAGSVPGIYTLEVEAVQGAETVGFDESTFQVRDRAVEFYDAALDRGFLESVADQSGGRYYPLEDIGDLPEDAVYTEGESSVIEQRELWDVPALFMLLTLTLGGEWFWRKQKGFA